MSSDFIGEDLRLFIDESNEIIETLEEALMSFERQGPSDALMQEMFRAAHTLKGSSATAGFTEMASVTHHLENVLSLARDGALGLDNETTDLLLRTCDWLRAATLSVESMAAPPDPAAITACLEQVHPGTTSMVGFSETDRSVPDIEVPPHTEHLDLRTVTIRFEEDAQMVGVRMFQALMFLEESAVICGSVPTVEEMEIGDARGALAVYIATDRADDEITDCLDGIEDMVGIEISSWTPKSMASEPEPALAPSPAAPLSQPRTLAQTIRIDVTVVDSLMNLIGELIIDRTRLAQLVQDLKTSGKADEVAGDLGSTLAHLNRITSEMQEGIMRARLMPLKNLFKKYPRMIRDLSLKTQKEVDFSTEGEETELDRSVLEALDDPLIHLLRNCIDHGLECPEEREKMGKPRNGKVSITASHEESHVVILVSDDGKGIDPVGIRQAAVKKGIISEEAASHLSHEQAIDLIFAPGFSTAQKVDETSGRGVGMDVVRTNLKRINATVSVKTSLGVGTTFALRLPLTLAIVKALLVSVGNDKYAIPLTSVQEVVEIEHDAVRTLNGREVLMVRGRAEPLIRLNHLFANVESVNQHAVVVRSSTESVAFAVDSLIGEQEIVVKSLGKMLENLSGISGATILGEGDVALILDVDALFAWFLKNRLG